MGHPVLSSRNSFQSHSITRHHIGGSVRRQGCLRRHVLLLRLLRLQLLGPRLAGLVGLEGAQLPGAEDSAGTGVMARQQFYSRLKSIVLLAVA